MTGARRWPVALAASLALGVVVVWIGASPAVAHDKYGTFQLQPSNQTAPLTVAFRIRLIYNNDTEPVSTAGVSVRGTGPGGASVGPVPMPYTGSDGYYAGTVVFPAAGSWSMTFSTAPPFDNSNPQATYTHSQVVTGPAPTTPTPTAGPSPTVTSGPVPTVTAAPSPTSGGNAVSTTTAPSASSTTSSTPTDSETTAPSDSSVPAAADGATTVPPARTPGTSSTAARANDEQASVQIQSVPSSASVNWVAVGLGAGAATVSAGVALFVMIRRTPVEP